MKKLLSAIAVVMLTSTLFGQVGINTSNPESTLDIRAKNHLGTVSSADGVLVPRVNDLSVNGSVNGQLVYLISNAGSFTKGFYYWNGTAWTGFGGTSGDPTNDAWINDNTNTMVKLGTQSDGTTRAPGTEFISKDNGAVGIGTAMPADAAILELVSTNRGFLLPRMTEVQRDAIATPVTSLLIFNSDKKCLEQYRNTIEQWYNFCDRTISGAGSADVDCSSSKINGSRLFYGGTAMSVPAGYTVTLKYNNGNGGKYPAFNIQSTGVTGLTATAPAGNVAMGDGSITFNISGTYNSSGTANFTVQIGNGAACTFSIDIRNGMAASNCTSMIGANIPNYPLSTTINIGGENVQVSKIMVGNNSGAAGYTASHCGANLIDDGSNVRIGGPSDGVVTSIKLIFSKPVNDVSIVASWFNTNDAISVTTNSTGTIVAANVLSSCLSRLAITYLNSNKKINVQGLTGSANTTGLTFIARATAPYTEITMGSGATSGDDTIDAFAVCDAYVQ
ncbi:hypothetical protein [Chryseobacterium aureum]|uniref:hypothetical protein n=1 Tax=Chryseobacterium aureum TaxID=2497456 RepID=UPI000F880FEB|nr:hypothetical protein [Chryseobacterium aureum]